MFALNVYLHLNEGDMYEMNFFGEGIPLLFLLSFYIIYYINEKKVLTKR